MVLPIAAPELSGASAPRLHRAVRSRHPESGTDVVLRRADERTEGGRAVAQRGVQISDGHISNLLIKDQGAFHAEKDALYRAGLASSPWQHLDDTSTRVNGQNGYCHIVCNPLSTAYFTTAAKDRLTIIDVLTNPRPRRFLVNAEALGYLEALGLSTVRHRQVGQLPGDVLMD